MAGTITAITLLTMVTLLSFTLTNAAPMADIRNWKLIPVPKTRSGPGISCESLVGSHEKSGYQIHIQYDESGRFVLMQFSGNGKELTELWANSSSQHIDWANLIFPKFFVHPVAKSPTFTTDSQTLITHPEHSPTFTAKTSSSVSGTEFVFTICPYEKFGYDLHIQYDQSGRFVVMEYSGEVHTEFHENSISQHIDWADWIFEMFFVRPVAKSPTFTTDSQTITARPEDSSRITARPEDALSITAPPENSSRITARPEDSSRITARPEDSSRITARPEDASRITALPEDSSRITARREDSSTFAAHFDKNWMLYVVCFFSIAATFLIAAICHKFQINSTK